MIKERSAPAGAQRRLRHGVRPPAARAALWDRRRVRCALAISVAVLLVAPSGAAAQPVGATNAVPGRANLRITPDRQHDLSVGGGAPVRLTLATPPQRRGPPSVQDTITREGRIIVVRVPVLGKSAPSSEVWLGVVEGKTAKPRWTGFVGAKDSDGENLVHLEVGPTGVHRFETLARISRCDGAPVKLFPSRFDFATNQFVAAAASPTPAAKQMLVARRQGDGRTVPPRIAFPFAVTSALPADATVTDVSGLVAPLAVSDGDPDTAWIEKADVGGNTLTARATGDGVVITGFSLLPGAIESAQQYAAHGRARAISLLLGPAAEQRFDVQFENVDDAGGRRRPYVITLPKPVASSCVTIVTRDVVAGKDQPATIAWSEATVLTDLDSATGAGRLLSALSGPDCRERVGDARSLGAGAGPKLVSALASAPTPGPARSCLLDALLMVSAPSLDATTSERLMEALPALLGQGLDAGEERSLYQLLGQSKSPPAATLGRLVRDGSASETTRLGAARALARLGGADTRIELLASVGEGPTGFRQELRRQVAMANPTSDDVRAALNATPSTVVRRRAELLSILAESLRRTGARPVGLITELTALVRDDAGDFVVRGRAIQALAIVADGPATTALEQLTRPPVEPPLRLLATRALAGVAAGKAAGKTTTTETGRTATAALRKALTDPDPAVREAAAEGLGQARDAEASALLISAAKQEPWPMVRRAELEAIATLCGPGAGDLLARAVERDVTDLRRIGLSGLFRCKDPRAIEIGLALIRRPDEPPALRTHAATLLGGSRDPGATKGLADAMEELTNQAPSDPGLETVALAAIRALASLGGTGAESSVVALHNHPHVPIRRAALQALGQLCTAKGVESILRAANTDPDPVIAATARASARQCRVDVGPTTTPSVPVSAPNAGKRAI
jgi:HEAT repeat protein